MTTWDESRYNASCVYDFMLRVYFWVGILWAVDRNMTHKDKYIRRKETWIAEGSILQFQVHKPSHLYESLCDEYILISLDQTIRFKDVLPTIFWIPDTCLLGKFEFRFVSN